MTPGPASLFGRNVEFRGRFSLFTRHGHGKLLKPARDEYLGIRVIRRLSFNSFPSLARGDPRWSRISRETPRSSPTGSWVCRLSLQTVRSWPFARGGPCRRPLRNSKPTVSPASRSLTPRRATKKRRHPAQGRRGNQSRPAARRRRGRGTSREKTPWCPSNRRTGPAARAFDKLQVAAKWRAAPRARQFRKNARAVR